MLGVWHLWEVLGVWHLLEVLVFDFVYDLLTKTLEISMRPREDPNVLFAKRKKFGGLQKIIAPQLLASAFLSLLLAVGQNYITAIIIYGNVPFFSASGIYTVKVFLPIKPAFNVLMHYVKGRAKVNNPIARRSLTIEMEIRALRMTKADLPLRESWANMFMEE